MIKPILLGERRVILEIPQNKHNYFGWPTVARLGNGKIGVAVSADRLRHVDPFGKTVLSLSEDDGETFFPPYAVINTTLDDRDGGLCAFGENSLIVTSFNNTRALQRKESMDKSAYPMAYLDAVTDEEEARDLGATFRISHNGGATFGPLMKSPVTSPHGPLALPDGDLLWVGRVYDRSDGNDGITVYRISPEGKMTWVGDIPDVVSDDGSTVSANEPHAILLPDGTLLAHIRVERYEWDPFRYVYFTVYQSESKDLGKTWTKPHRIFSENAGAPPHILRHSSGVLISSVGKRQEPFGVCVAFSEDEGKTWSEPVHIWDKGVSLDMGYPSTVELKDGSLLTVFYGREDATVPCAVMAQKWKMEK